VEDCLLEDGLEHFELLLLLKHERVFRAQVLLNGLKPASCLLRLLGTWQSVKFLRKVQVLIAGDVFGSFKIIYALHALLRNDRGHLAVLLLFKVQIYGLVSHFLLLSYQLAVRGGDARVVCAALVD